MARKKVQLTLERTRDQGRPVYYEENGLRKIVPYTFAYEVHTKEDHAIKSGTILVNNEIVSADTILNNNDLIRNIAHRHEPPVVAGPINIVHRDEARGLMVVEKPGSMPVHPTGRYNFNTLLEILKHAHGLEKVHTANRLDRLTSGVMVCATTLEASRFLGTLFATEGAVQKEYLARVSGRFPEEEVTCQEPLLTMDRQLGLNVVHPDGRPAKTIFKRLSYHARTDTSVLHCRPITGRSHQIRVHLQFLGFPISNDPIYSSQVWGRQGGPQSAKGGFFRDPEWLAEQSLKEQKERELISTEDLRLSSNVPVPRELHQIVKDLRQLRDQESPERLLARDQLQPSVLANGSDDLHNEPAGPFGPATMDFRTEDETGPYCRACGVPVLEDPKPEHLFIWLHALRYHSEPGQFDFSSPRYPDWARDDWDGELVPPIPLV